MNTDHRNHAQHLPAVDPAARGATRGAPWGFRALIAAAFMAVSACAASAQTTTRIYVDANAAPGGNGTSWASALRTLQEGLAGAVIVAPQPSEIWVAQGTYKATSNSTPFVFPSNGPVKLYGGFVSGAFNLTDRNPDAHPTIITGDINGDSSLFGTGNNDDAAEVMAVSGAPSTSLIDGFTFNYARARLMRIDSGSQLRVSNCTFEGVFPAAGIDAQGIIISGSSTAPKFVRNIVRYVAGGDMLTSGTFGANGSNGSNGADGGPGGPAGSGGNGQNGINGGPGSSGGFATGILVTSGATPAIVANRVNSIRGGRGGDGGSGSNGGRGGDGGTGLVSGAAGGNAGNGGNGGSGGAGGAGGDAIAIAYNTTSTSPAIAMNLVYDVRGGNGGTPGFGGQGGRGGNGGNGGSSTTTGGRGGNAGAGGNGGVGGAGGAAGKAVFVSTTLTSTTRSIINNTISRATAGIPGIAGPGGVFGLAGTAGLGGSGVSPGANGSAAVNGSTGANGAAGTPPVINGLLLNGTGTVSALNNIIDLPSVPTGTVTIATSTGPIVTVDHSLLSTSTVQGNVSLGTRAFTGSPNFYSPEGQDGILGTDDDDFSLKLSSPAFDAGANSAVPTDLIDDDADGNTNEVAPLDIAGNPRFTDVPAATDTGVGAAPVVDIGAFEADVTPPAILVFAPFDANPDTSPVTFALVFDRPVDAVPLGLLSTIVTGGVNSTGLSIERITDSTFQITITFTAADAGSLSVNLSDVDTIRSQVGIPLNGPGSANLASLPAIISFGGGGTPPTISDFFISGSNFAEPNTTRSFGIQFSENVEGFDQSDIQLTTGSLSGASITNFFSNGNASYTIEVNTGTPSGNPTGTIILRLTDNDSIVSSLSGLPLDGTGTGQVFDSPPLTVALPTDCNNNGIPDAIDISNGTAQDCNLNGIPDSCDIAGFQLDQSFGPTPYLSRADSPFNLSGLGTTAYLEDFEDGALNTPGVSADTSSICGCGGLTDSVDGDDGTIDGSGASGKSLFAGNGTTGITFNFNTAAFGRLPQFAGVVWTDGGFGSTFSFEAFDGLGQSIGTFSTGTGDFQNAGTTAEDRFFGIVHSAGVGSIRVRNVTGGGGIEVDHLQYGLITGTPDINNNGIPDSCEIGPGSNYYADNSWRSNPNQPQIGWNLSPNFDDSDSAGWSSAFIIGPAPAPFNNTVWSSPGLTGGTGKAYLRKKIRLLANPSVAVLRASADDDITVTVNGVVVVSDSNGFSGPEQTVDITDFLAPGDNLVAVEATDTICCGRGAQVSLQLTGGDPDCNGNGIADNLDIFNGTATDANTNGVPDACEETGGTVRPFPFDLARAVNLPAFAADPLQYPLHTADINSDGLVDYITSGATGPRLSIRGGPGELMFFNLSPASPVPVTDTVAADFNRDGNVDLVSSAASGGNSLVTFRNVGKGFSQNVAGGSVTSPVRRLAVIDANNDGSPDVIGLRADGQVQLFINTGAQGDPIAFQAVTIDVPKFSNTNNTFDLDVADFNHDGKQDFVMVYGGLAVMQNNGDATFDAAINFNASYSSAVFADLSGDGFRAVVAGLYAGGGTIIDPFDFTRSLGSFAGGRPLDIVAGDIDGDGNEDFAVLDSTGTVSWHRQEFLGSIVSRTVFRAAGSFNAITLADADPDGDLDLALINVTTVANRSATADESKKSTEATEPPSGRSTQSIPNVRIVPNRRLHRQADMYGTAGIANSGDAPTAAVVADMNRDGRDDLVTACFFDDTISWSTLDYEGPTEWTRTTIINSAATPRPDGPASIAAADLDNDGDTDVVAAGIINGVVMWFENTSNGAAFTPHMIDAAAPGASCVAVADIDGNGRIDVVAGLSTSGSIRVYRNFASAGVPNFIKETPINSGAASVRSIALGDLDRDGLIDIVAAAYGSNQLRLYPQSIFNPRPGNDAQGEAGTTASGGDRGLLPLNFDLPIIIAQSTPTCVTLADFNNDGRLDIACSSFTEGNVKVRLSQGPFEYTSVVTAMTSLDGCSWVHAADIDDDGLIDLAATGRNNRGFDRAKNLGNGTQWGISSLFAFLEAPTVCVSGDFDDDGKTDLAAGSFNNDRFIWSANYGEALYAYMGSSASAITEGTTSKIADIYASNLAATGDPSISYTLFSGSFYDRGYVYNGPPQALLSAQQVNALISKIDVYADSNADGSFSFSDTLVATLSGPFTFDTFGNLNFPISASSEANQVPPSINRFYFVVVTAQPGASAATPNTFSLNLDISGNTFTDTTFTEPVQNRYGGTYQTGTVTVGPDFRANCPSDLNFNGRTDTADLVIFLGRFGTDTLPFSAGDLTGDGRVNTPDLVKFLAKFGTGCN
jgi:hypothetical protein